MIVAKKLLQLIVLVGALVLIGLEIFYYYRLIQEEKPLHIPREILESTIDPVVKKESFYQIRLGRVGTISAEHERDELRYAFGTVINKTETKLILSNNEGGFEILLNPKGQHYVYDSLKKENIKLDVEEFITKIEEGDKITVNNFIVKDNSCYDYFSIFLVKKTV